VITRVLSKQTGLSYRKIDYWLRAGFVDGNRPEFTPGSGYARELSGLQIDVLRYMGILVTAGLRPDVAGAIARTHVRNVGLWGLPPVPIRLEYGVVITLPVLPTLEDPDGRADDDNDRADEERDDRGA
jgi:hypothetical protein